MPTPTEPTEAPPTRLDVVVLAGGRSRRMGRDKALLPRDGGRQVDHVVALLRQLGGTIILARGQRPLDVRDTVEVADEPGIDGPLGGVVAGLAAATTPLVGLVAADLVAPDVRLLRALARHVADHAWAGAAPVVDGRLQPLHAVVARRAVTPIREAGRIHGGVIAALAAAGVAGIDEETWRPWSPSARPGDDLDTPADLARHRRPDEATSPPERDR